MSLSLLSMYAVSTRERKDVRINVKTKPSLRLRFRAVSILEEATMSDLVNQFMRKTANEVESRNPEQFKLALEQAREEEEAERNLRQVNKTPPLFDVTQKRYEMSIGSETPVKGKRRSQSIKQDVEDATKDAIERTRQKKSPKSK